jgi:hypothetical protein
MSKTKRRKVGGFIGLYWHYRYLLGNVPKRGSPRQTSFHLKEDLMKLDKINIETKLLVREHIETAEQLFSYRDTCTQEIETLTTQRDRHWLDYRIAKTPEDKEAARAKVHAATSEIKKLRKEVSLCSDIAARSGEIKEKLSVISEQEKQTKEKQNVQLRRSR